MRTGVESAVLLTHLVTFFSPSPDRSVRNHEEYWGGHPVLAFYQHCSPGRQGTGSSPAQKQRAVVGRVVVSLGDLAVSFILASCLPALLGQAPHPVAALLFGGGGVGAGRRSSHIPGAQCTQESPWLGDHMQCQGWTPGGACSPAPCPLCCLRPTEKPPDRTQPWGPLHAPGGSLFLSPSVVCPFCVL